jgi:hypothetical protein
MASSSSQARSLLRNALMGTPLFASQQTKRLSKTRKRPVEFPCNVFQGTHHLHVRRPGRHRAPHGFRQPVPHIMFLHFLVAYDGPGCTTRTWVRGRHGLFALEAVKVLCESGVYGAYSV